MASTLRRVTLHRPWLASVITTNWRTQLAHPWVFLLEVQAFVRLRSKEIASHLHHFPHAQARVSYLLRHLAQHIRH